MSWYLFSSLSRKSCIQVSAVLQGKPPHFLPEQDALERAYNKDVEGASQDAVKLYRLGLNIIHEGLSLRIPSAGLGPAFSNVARWREDMKQWLQRANDRHAPGCRFLS